MAESKHIRYKSGYKFQLYEDVTFETGILVGKPVGGKYFILYATGELLVKSGYAWDGASGPMPDAKEILRGSLCHDALYQMLREGLLDQKHRKTADDLLKKHCLQDGMAPMIAEIVYQAVRKFAGGAAAPKTGRPILIAP